MNKSAHISADGLYRYELTREWDADLPTVGFIMLNPSTADDSIDDPTIKKCIKFAKRWSYGRLYVGNLYGWRATDPRQLDNRAVDVVGRENDDALRRLMRASEIVVCAWGTKCPDTHREPYVRNLLKSWGGPTVALRITAAGHPGHPLYIRDDAKLIPYA